MTVKTLELDRVTPFSASPLSLPLTFLDLFWLKFLPVERLFFYRVSPLTTAHFTSHILPKLKTSLSLTLSHYLPLSARLVWNPQDAEPCIVYSPDDAVSLKVAESQLDMVWLSSDEPRPTSLLRPLVPEFQVFDDWAPVITLQVTMFPDQGFCIGIASHHAILDGKTTTTFMKAWAHVCKTQMTTLCPLPEDLTPFYDRTYVKELQGLKAKLLDFWMSLGQGKSLKLIPQPGFESELVLASFELTQKDITVLRDCLRKQSEDANKLRLSPFVVAFAYFVACLVKARRGDENRQVVLGFAADYRRRLDPPVPPTYLGNCVGGAGSFDNLAGEFIGPNGFLVAAEKLTVLISSLHAEALDKLADLFISSAKLKPGTQLISVSGSNHFGVYKTDFGWGRPEKVEIVSIENNQAVSLSESRKEDDKGLNIGVCLEQHEMKNLTSLFSHGLDAAASGT